MHQLPSKLTPGRKSTIVSHDQRAGIELACAAGTSLRTIAETFGVSRSAVDRHWRSLSPEYRAELASMAEDLRRYEERTRRAFISNRRTIQISAGNSHARAA